MVLLNNAASFLGGTMTLAPGVPADICRSIPAGHGRVIWPGQI